jgi:hypothetical protein
MSQYDLKLVRLITTSFVMTHIVFKLRMSKVNVTVSFNTKSVSDQ